MKQYHLAINGKPTGPFSVADIEQMIRNGNVNGQTLAFTEGMANWVALNQLADFAASFAPRPNPISTSMTAPSDPTQGMPAGMTTGMSAGFGMNYEVVGHEMQFVEIGLDPNQTIIAEAGSMLYMTQGVQLDTQMGDGSRADQGIMGKLFEAGKRVITGATLFLTTFTSRSGSREYVAFSAPFPGKIVPMNLTDLGGSVLCERHSFLCASLGTRINVEFTKRIGAGFFGGEGFILQRLSGNGIAFIHAGGTVVPKDLRPGETLRVDTGCLVAFQPSVTYDVQYVGSIKTAIFGGEGLFFVTLTGPGRVWLQSLPFSRLADRILAAAPRAGGSRRETGSILGGIGDLIGGDQD
jgi:uncharacterized protein (TIGR00266 family)